MRREFEEIWTADQLKPIESEKTFRSQGDWTKLDRRIHYRTIHRRRSSEDVINPYCERSATIRTRSHSLFEHGDFYAVHYVNRFYIGQILGSGANPSFYKMKFLHKTMVNGAFTFKWPIVDDTDGVHKSAIFQRYH